MRDETYDGSLYRVRLPAWPQTDGWLRACSLSEYAERYAAPGEMAERASLTRARHIAGDAELGARFLATCQSFVYREQGGENRFDTIPVTDRDQDETLSTVELLTQSFQLRHGARHAALRHTGTLGTLDAMGKAGLISEHLCRELDHAYVFLRSTEHRRQLGLHEDLQKQIDASRERVRSLVRSVRV